MFFSRSYYHFAFCRVAEFEILLIDFLRNQLYNHLRITFLWMHLVFVVSELSACDGGCRLSPLYTLLDTLHTWNDIDKVSDLT